jgi:hypothetical protein
MDEYNNREEIFSQSVRAGKRTYFFDVKETKNKEFYLTLTESKKLFPEGKKPYFEKHKIFLYKEDFEKFATAFRDAIEFIEERQPYTPPEPKEDEAFTNIEFDDLEQ